YHEEDNKFNSSVGKSSSKKFIFISSSGASCNESYFIDMNDDNMTLNLIASRQEEIFYDIDHNDKYFYISINDVGDNFRIVRTKIETPKKEYWEEYIKLDPDKYLESFDITAKYLILNYKRLGIVTPEIIELKSGARKIMTFKDPVYEVGAYSTNFEENDIRLSYSSLAQPSITYQYDFNDESFNILKEQEIPSGFDSSHYQVERLWVDNENVKVPVTILYKKELFKKDGTNPLYLYGYGSYGISIPASFRTSIFSLVDKGFVFAIAHIRGGEELGHSWHKEAKFLNKMRTFKDFIAASESLIKQKYTSKGNIVIAGGSAGGMLIGAVINEKPDLYKAAILHVPFVDVLNTMLDESLPLTPGEYKEWGNPKDEEYFKYMLQYSPYENIKAQNYPNIFVTAGLSDPRVGYWEAAKFVAKLQEVKTDSNMLMLKTNMDFGHSGASGRFDYLKEIAEDYVFVLKNFAMLK
ncbi:MAG: prolyl oligopeptidase family serine peptidase, partial [Rickettsiaceae bacterium]|nr:prolyl oligopeptidase family serine peptidase [Rickettsiaceae bacterium]